MKKNFFFLTFLIATLSVSVSGCSSDDDDNTTPVDNNNNGENSSPNEGDKDDNNYTNGSPYISKVLEYSPAPGQFVNDLPRYEVGDTNETMRKKVEDFLVGEDSKVITLGGYGGYVVFGFDHTVQNKKDLCDFRVKGNAFTNSSEPGIILVAYDANKNGIPDDNEWYEIAGSEYSKTTTIYNYKITYSKPATDADNVEWVDNQNAAGAVLKNSYHKQAYYPSWITNTELIFSGTLIAKNGVKNGAFWSLISYPWGYADNFANSDDKSAIDIDWAVDKNGSKVDLPGIDFVKVYTGVNFDAGMLGEASTEVAGAEDLHLLGKEIQTALIVK